MSASHWGVIFTLLTLLSALFAATAEGVTVLPATTAVLLFQSVALICFLIGARASSR
jgi:hypothetical protein